MGVGGSECLGTDFFYACWVLKKGSKAAPWRVLGQSTVGECRHASAGAGQGGSPALPLGSGWTDYYELPPLPAWEAGGRLALQNAE